jgi:hypothetical protein
MSYTIGPVRGATKDAVLKALAAKFDTEVLPAQPDHTHDRDAHLAGIERELALLPDASDTLEYVVSMSGWLSWRNLPDGSKQYVGGGFSGSASLVPAPTAPPAPAPAAPTDAASASMLGNPHDRS